MTAAAGGATRDSARRWRQAGRSLAAKLIAELAYEELLVPEPLAQGPDAGARGPGTGAIGRGPIGGFRLRTTGATYTFQARRGTFGSWWIEPASLVRGTGSAAPAVPSVDPSVIAPAKAPADDPVQLLRDARPDLGWSDAVLADVIRDLLATQAADHRLLGAAKSAAELAELSFVELEGELTGHPCLVANKGRLGFGAVAAATYTPEARTPFRLLWVAAHRTIGRYELSAGLSPPTVADLLAEELDAATLARFAAVLAATAGPRSAPDDYLWLPVHPWQWENVIVPFYAAEIATGLLVPLGEGPDRYLPLQAVRTLANVDRPDRRNVKLALMIRNTLVWRGISPADAAAGPAVSRWLLQLRDCDPFLREVTRMLPLPEIAGATVAHPAYDGLPGAPYRLHELLGVLWRDPVERFLAPGERARSLASLLAVGIDGRALVAELVDRSGQTAREWCAALLTALLPPLLHYLYRYGVAFTPHGENIICVFDAAGMPDRIAVKDFGADIELVQGDFPERRGMPADAAAHCRAWPGRLLAHSVLSALVAGHFRYFSVLVADQLGLREEEFWRLVRATVDTYHERFPAQAPRFRMIDLLVPRFDRVCLNREQFAGAGFHDRADRDGGFDLMHGEVTNPLHSVSAVGENTKGGAENR